jgi:dihydrolipoamide dehydrogenase
VEVEGQERRFKVESRAVILATGSRPAVPSIPGVEYVVTTAYLSEITEVPGRVVFIGGGPEGVEFGTVLRDMGAEVTVVEVLDTLMPLEDQDIGVFLAEILSASGVEVKVKTTVQSISESGEVKTVSIQGAAGEERLEADLVVVAMGRSLNSENLGLEDFSVAVEDGWIVVDDHMATNVKGVYAVGDVVGGGLVHVASAQGAVAAENALGSESIYDGRVVPRCIYTRPQVAAVGLTEKAARAEGFYLKIGRSDMKKNAKASVVDETKGFVKILADASNGRILGVHIIGENASEIISEASLAMRLDATVGDIASTIHLYPTVSDALREAARDAEDSSIYST